MSRIIVNKFYPGILYSNAVFKSAKNSHLIMNTDGTIILRELSGNTNRYLLEFINLKMPIRKIGMDSNGIMRVISDIGIQYPLSVDYSTLKFRPRELYGILQDDCSFGVFDKSNNKMVYRARLF